MIIFGESNPILVGCQTGDQYPVNLGRDPLKEGQEERVAQIVLHRLERRPHAHDDALHESPLLVEGII